MRAKVYYICDACELGLLDFTRRFLAQGDIGSSNGVVQWKESWLFPVLFLSFLMIGPRFEFGLPQDRGIWMLY